jgi:membrane protein DedA with SNARE-associated domain
MMVGAALMALAVAAGIAAGLLIPYWLGRLVLDRRRLAAWESAWALTGPRWSSRR